jgi:alcohol dehydrogenase
MLAKQALVLLSKHIMTATHEGSNVEARQAFANAPVAAVQALAYPLGRLALIFHMA